LRKQSKTSLVKYKYKINTSYDNLDIIKSNAFNSKIYNLDINDKNITFYTNSLNKINGLFEFTYINQYRNKIIYFIKEYLITFIGILLFLFMLIIINRTITEVTFVDESTYDENVYNDVISELDSVYKFKFLNKSLSSINETLKKTFYNYEWINVEKEGTKLLINISKSIDDNKNTDNNEIGSLYSKYDAYITGYYVKNGKILISNNTSVKREDELISGVIPIYGEKKEYVKAEGYVIGEVYEIKIVSVDKSNESIKRTGKYKSYTKVIIGNDNEIIDSPFENYDSKITELASIFDFIKVVRIELYEISESVITYDVDSGEIYSKSQIVKEFNEEIKYDFEKIKSIKLIKTQETDDSYVYTYGVIYVRDITYFKELK